MATDFCQAIRDRRNRAIEVEETYTIEPLSLQAWVIQHPDDPERCYLVDMMARRCTCPDWSCTAQGLGIDCKHILAVASLWEEATGLQFERQGHCAVYDESEIAFSRRMAEVSKLDPFERI